MSSEVIQFPNRKRPPRIRFGDRLRVARRELGLRQAEMVTVLSRELPTVRDRAYGAWEAGTNEPSNIVEVCEALERATGYPREWFMGWNDTTPTPDGTPSRWAPWGSNPRPADYKVDGSLPIRQLRPALLEAVAA